MNFKHEIIRCYSKTEENDLRYFMKKHNQKSFTSNWFSQDMSILAFDGYMWRHTHKYPTITGRDFIAKYYKNIKKVIINYENLI